MWHIAPDENFHNFLLVLHQSSAEDMRDIVTYGRAVHKLVAPATNDRGGIVIFRPYDLHGFGRHLRSIFRLACKVVIG
jgi:hypothetical protein